MPGAQVRARLLGTMVAYGYPGGYLTKDLSIARRLGAEVLEILPDWRSLPDPNNLKDQVADSGFAIHSVHGSWGGQSIHASRVDLAALDEETHSTSVDDLKRCLDWLYVAGGSCLVVHPGGISYPGDLPARRDALARSLLTLADHARGMGVALCVENMPPGVHPGSLMADLASLVGEINHPNVALALDTGHANLRATASSETLIAGSRLRTTHVHDNDGRLDTHEPPGLGSVDWKGWVETLNKIDYRGPILLECIRHFRNFPDSISSELLELICHMTLMTRQA